MIPATPFSYRSDKSIPIFPDDKPIIVFDGHCVLCSGFARFVLRYDRLKTFRLLPAQSPLGTAVYKHYGLDPVDYQTNILLEAGQAYFKSEGSIRMFAHLGFPWNAALVLRIVPTSFRDRLYSVVARNRFRWFGRQEICFLSEPGHQDRFLG
jgi:predicted DCC family thiol-disulfide oxidoreductase YuxK